MGVAGYEPQGHVKPGTAVNPAPTSAARFVAYRESWSRPADRLF